MVYILVDPSTSQVTNFFYDVDKAPDSVKNSWTLTAASIPDVPTDVPVGQVAMLYYDQLNTRFYYQLVNVYSLADAQAAKIAQLEDIYNQKISAGFQSSALGAVHSYPSDAEARENIQIIIKRLEIAEKQATAAGVDLTIQANRPTYEYLTLDAGPLAHNLDQLEQAFADGVDTATPIDVEFRKYRDQAKAATTPDQVNAIIWQ